ncbi:hypothetical protein HCU64_14885 [Methylobacterium sp. C25]|uniref:hypothetical protein n=1 Tax=Methylobacterium sp. C25 TaxID=2721622 RepID=UPI001F357660|nr:hypothetical protein [Methylobacterium sp. C25]MCE4225043.1 hypothetical protein [Methylobacterium sp. C25]
MIIVRSIKPPFGLVVLALSLGPAFALNSSADSGMDTAGVVQRAGAFDRYPTRPSWKVSGIDYAVGIPAGTVLKPPTSISDKRVSIHADAKRVDIGGNGVVLDAYDFSGWQIELLPGAGNLTITRSRFISNSKQKLSSVYALRGGTVKLIHNLFDGGGAASAVNPLVSAGAGGAIIEYNVFRNVPNDAINITQDGDYTIQYNLFDSLNFGAGHTDCVQTFFTGIKSLKINYNTVYQPAPGVDGFPGGGNSFVRVGDQRGQTVEALEIGHNTLIFRGEGTARFANVFDISVDGGAVLNPTIHDNFVDSTGVLYGIWSPYYNELTNPIYYDNRDLTKGAPLRAGPYNSRTAGVPTRSPAPPVVTSLAREGERITLKGTAQPGTQISLTTASGLRTGAKVERDGGWMIVATLSPDIKLGDLRAVDTWGNASPATVSPLNPIETDKRVGHGKSR